MLLTNALYFIIVDKDIKNKILEEFKNEVTSKLPQGNSIHWESALNYDTLGNLKYLSMVLNETLRIRPSAHFSFMYEMTEKIEVSGYTILPNHPILISIYLLHHNKDEWKDHDRFIPERFDPNSEYYLTPSGKRRSPFSYGPFLGGKRICIGKTFAENLVRCVLSIIVSQLDFEFVDKSLYEKRPVNNFANIEPTINVKVKIHDS